ncbi:uncharacterized protein C8A04DRAFT_15399 [Dichotomopilus funicola]|uniref:Uncharacterized protein n=1 Tax=Dichotomopilus funicola TaxID=1934379 RepID=A0AAN6ZJ99_9PEZI|nr:hypothetical protein C8A04DRAFT_15399 [Dichotomopilus funicola]
MALIRRFSAFLPIVSASLFSFGQSVVPRQQLSDCSDKTPIQGLWEVTHVNVTHDQPERPGTASWSVLNTLTNTTEDLNCTLRANYICELDGTPEDDSFHIWLQINLNIAAFTLNQTLTCQDQLVKCVFQVVHVLWRC